MKTTLMFKIFFASTLVLIFNQLNAQILLNQNFNYSGNLSSNGWAVHSGSVYPIVTTSGLSYDGYAATSSTNNAALVNNVAGEDNNLSFTTQNTNGQNMYFSFLVNVTDAAIIKTGDYFIHLGTGGGATFSTFSARIFAKIVGGNVNFGISNVTDGTTVVYDTTNFVKNTTYLIMVKYSINTASNDPIAMWVIKSGVPASEAIAGPPSATNAVTSGANSIGGLGLRQADAASIKTVVDAIRVGVNWADLIDPVLGTVPFKFEYLKLQKQNNGHVLNWKVTCLSTNIVMEVERASDAKSFQSITLLSATQARCSQPFDFMDLHPLKGNNFYRLKMIDVDGKITYSPTALILNGSKGLQLVGVFPSIVKNETVLSISSEKAITFESSITNIYGRTIKKFKQVITPGSNLINMDCSNLSTGTYNYTIHLPNGFMQTIRFIKL